MPIGEINTFALSIQPHSIVADFRKAFLEEIRHRAFVLAHSLKGHYLAFAKKYFSTGALSAERLS